MTFTEFVGFWIGEAIRFFSPQTAAIEWFFAGSIVLIYFVAPAKQWNWTERAGARFAAVASRTRLVIVLCGIVPVAVRVALLSVFPVPEPSIHDEFSHLLLADTLAHGRLSNPAHPFWQHFESIHIIQQPTYSSMYPPANGMFLAAGKMIAGEPWAGVLLSGGLMFAALCWMMQQWLPASWALYGTTVAICRIGIFGSWLNSYLGGPVSALGGALLIGAVPGLRKSHPRSLHSILFGTGLVILMNSRPFEGAVLSLAAFLYLLPSLIRRLRTAGVWPTRTVWAPAAGLLILGFAFTGYYSWRVTGNPTKLPYEVNRETYGWPENLAFLPARTVTFRHRTLSDMYRMEIDRRQHLKKWDTFTDDILRRVFENWIYYLGPLLTIPFLAAIPAARRSGTLPLLVFAGLICCLNLFQLVLYPYHLGPVVAIGYALVAVGVSRIYEHLKAWRPGATRMILIALPLCLLTNALAKQEADTIGLPVSYWERSAEPHGVARASILHWLSARPGKHLVLVRYSREHSPNQEWVYNGGDIDGSKVVWAREMDVASDKAFLNYFRDRKVWLLEADRLPWRVRPWTSDAGTGAEETVEASACPAQPEAPDEP